MKIAYVTATSIPSQAANSVHMMKMAQALSQNGHEVHLLCKQPQDPEYSEEDERIFLRYNVRKIFTLHFGGAVQNKYDRFAESFKRALLAKKMRCELLFSRCMITAWLGCFMGQPTIFESHDSPHALSRLSVFLFKSLLRRKKFLGLIVISHALKQHIAENFSIVPDKIFVAPDGSDPVDAKVLETTQAPFEKEPGKFYAGYVGHLYKGRGIELIIGAAEALPHVEFHIVGGAPEDKAHWLEQSRALPNIHFHGFVDHAQVELFLTHFDIVLAPYQAVVQVSGNEGNTANWMSPLKIFEYMAAGKAIVCSDLPVLREVLEDKRNALLCQADNQINWIWAINTLCQNRDFCREMGETAQADFLEHYTWEKRATNIIRFVQERLE